MNRVIDFFKRMEGVLYDVNGTSESEETKSKGWKDNVVATLLIIGSISSPFIVNPVHAESLNNQESVLNLNKNKNIQDYLKEGNSLIRSMYIQGMLSQKYKVNVINPKSSESEAITIPGLPCQVNWGINNNGLTQSLIQGVDLKQNDLYRDMTLLHETSHCELLKIKSPFQNSGLKPETEAWLNEWVIGGMIPQNAINNFFAENFADSYGMLMLLSKNNFSEESVSELKRWYEIRKIKREMDERQGNSIVFDPHYTDFSLKRIIDSLDALKEQSPAELKKIALTYASESVVEWLNKNREMQPLNKDVSVPGNEGKIRLVGTEGSDIIISGFASKKWFYSAILGQVQLLTAEKQKLVKKPYVFQTYGENESRIIASGIIDDMKDSPFTKAKVKLTNKKDLKWNFESEERGKIYISYILNTLDSDNVIEKWQYQNNWNSVQKDIENTLSKKYKSNILDITLPSLTKLSEKLKDKPFSTDVSNGVKKDTSSFW